MNYLKVYENGKPNMLPVLPQRWVYGEKVPFQESDVVEFKRVSIFSGLFNLKTTKSSGLPKYKETINAFLNSKGGYLIMGVLDDGTIIGVENMTEDMVDKFNLWIDSCFNNFVYKDGTPLNPTQVFLKIHTFPVINSDFSIIVVEAINKGPPLNIMTRCGTILYRLSASNYKMVSEPIYRKRDVKGMIKSMKKHTQMIIDEKHKAIRNLQERHLDEIKEIIKGQAKESREYIDKISTSLYHKYKMEKKESFCSKILRYFVDIYLAK